MDGVVELTLSFELFGKFAEDRGRCEGMKVAVGVVRELGGLWVGWAGFKEGWDVEECLGE